MLSLKLPVYTRLEPKFPLTGPPPDDVLFGSGWDNRLFQP